MADSKIACAVVAYETATVSIGGQRVPGSYSLAVFAADNRPDVIIVALLPSEGGDPLIWSGYVRGQNGYIKVCRITQN